MYIIFFFFNDTATTEIYTLSLHDALPISPHSDGSTGRASPRGLRRSVEPRSHWRRRSRAWRRRSCRAAVPLGNRVRRRGGWGEPALLAWRISVGGGRGEYGRCRAVASSHPRCIIPGHDAE